jgi:PAS domain S-box-containing protein
MKDQDKTKDQLINELDEMRQRVAELETMEGERKQVEEKLQEERNKAQRYLDIAGVIFVVLGADQKVSLINRKGCEILGYKEEEIIGKNWFDNFLAERVRNEVKAVFNKLMAGKIEPVEYFENPILTKTGQERTIVWYNTILTDEQGNVIGTLSSGEDITESRQAEAELQADRNKLATILDSIEDGVYIVNQQYDIQYVNTVLQSQFGPIEGRKCYQYFHDLKEPCPWCQNQSVFAGKTVRWEWYSFKNQRTYDLIDTPLRNADGSISKLEIFRDITERKQAEERENQLQQELNLASRLATVGEMSSGIAHEINNPLTGVMGFSQMLMEKDISDDIRKDVDIIYEGAKRIASITERMLTFARQRKPERTSVNINDIIETTLAMRAYEMKSSNIKVTTKLSTDIPLTFADAGQLQQVFLNIVLNAEMEMKLARGKGNLSVRTERIDNTIRLSFKDDGPGIPKKNLDRLFDPFFTTRDPDKGTGLGLSICYTIVNQHGGKIYARSQLRKGATFFVELPIVTQAEQLKMAEPAAEVSKTLSRARILVVDDDTIVQEFLTEMLGEEGHEVEIIANGDDALERLKSEDYDVILLDIKLPGMSGIELYEYMQNNLESSAKKVVFITGDVMGQETMDFLSRTTAPYIPKPFDTEQLKNDIDRILSQKA